MTRSTPAFGREFFAMNTVRLADGLGRISGERRPGNSTPAPSGHLWREVRARWGHVPKA